MTVTKGSITTKLGSGSKVSLADTLGEALNLFELKNTEVVSILQDVLAELKKANMYLAITTDNVLENSDVET